MNWRFWERIGGTEDCAAIRPLLSLYSDGMASAAEARRVAQHLPDCADCQQALRWMQATHQVITQRPPAVPPADLRARIARAIAEADGVRATPVMAPRAPARPARRPLALRPALAYGLSLALFAGVAGDLAWNAGHKPAPPSQVASTVAPQRASVPVPHQPSQHVQPSPIHAVHRGAALEARLPHHTFHPAVVPTQPIVRHHSDYLAAVPATDNTPETVPSAGTGAQVPVRPVRRAPLTAKRPVLLAKAIAPRPRLLTPKRINIAPPRHSDNPRVATNMPRVPHFTPREEPATQPRIAILPPRAVPEVRVARHEAFSPNQIFVRMAADQRSVAVTAHSVAVSSRNAATRGVAEVTDKSGTVAFTGAGFH